MKIKYDAVVGSGATPYYGTIVVSNLRYEDGSAVGLRQFLAMNFSAPAEVKDTDINLTLAAWVATTTDVDSVQIDTSMFSVSAQIDFASAHTMDAHDQITIGVNGDLTSNPDVS